MYLPGAAGLRQGSFVKTALTVAHKDLLVELRAKEILLAMAFFAAVVVLLFAFAFTHEGRSNTEASAGILWIAVALAGTLGLGRAFDREREGDTLRALLLAPAPRSAIYVGKLAAIVLLMLVTEACTVPLVALLFDAPLLGGERLPHLALLLVLGTVGYAAVGSLFGALLARTRGRDILLGILLYPIIIPVLIAGARGSEALLARPLDRATAWFWSELLLVFDAVFITVALWVYEPLVASE
jgi:heme exporter protein B